ncbi:CotH kinase family protein [Candidatus Uabimicrobium amorphum]|uniref:Right handed beta helix domain-containing protein n=1 Tax=Uabimicrobium amorphum TaxID=2596890 RepID=A0A5S9IQM9_UABAM|nr:CotH kinase family protein [Candidatus Uabimicrobium amorphum]BBM84895.1 hypothetical protein UABAM_03256 [Candidatus Uabimicrobium amorphum]
MKITSHKRRKTKKKFFSPLKKTFLVFLLLGFPIFFIYLHEIKTYIWKMAENRGHFWIRKVTLSSQLKQFPKLLKRMKFNNISRVYIDIKFEHLKKLHAKRQQALSEGILTQKEDDFVPAKMRFGERQVKCKLRLKGDWVDHLQGKKWSFRIHIKNGDQLFGLRRFSVHHPQTRVYQGELLFHETLRMFGVLALKYFFVDVTINGDSIGIMAVEEHFSKELLERNGRKEGVIIRFDESLFWKSLKYKDAEKLAFDSYLNADIDAFQSTKLQKSKRLTREYATAVGLLEGFREGKISSSEVFDAKLLGRYLAVCKFFGADHAVRWHNQRFYFNSLTMKLEPIGFDANIHFDLDIHARNSIRLMREPIVREMLKDPNVYNVFQATLNKLINDAKSGTLTAHLKKIEKPSLQIMQKEFIFLESFPEDCVKKMAQQVFTTNVQLLPIHIRAGTIENKNTGSLHIKNTVPYEVEILQIYWINKSGKTLKLETSEKLELPLVLSKTKLRTQPKSQIINYKALPPKSGYWLEIKSKIKGPSKVTTTRVKKTFPVLFQNPMPTDRLSNQLAKHSFLSVSGSNTINVKSGKWQVKDSIIIPKGYKLFISGDTTLQFSENGSMVVFGTTIFKGTAQNPIIFEGIAKSKRAGTWQGIATYNSETRCEWSHVIVNNTTGMNWPQWKLTGGVTFYKSDVDLSHCVFDGNRGEDALNIIHSNFKLEQIQIKNTIYDAFDGDFTTGQIENCLFQEIGSSGSGDGVDVSGSKIQVSNSKFIGVKDKAISVGEKSFLQAREVVIENCGIAAASKDNSILEINDSKIENVSTALMAYIKKAEYGPTKLIAKKVRITNSKKITQVQHGSYLEIDGEQVSAENLNVKKLYENAKKQDQ